MSSTGWARLRGVGDLQADLPDRPLGLVAERPFLGFQDDGHQGRDVLRPGQLGQRRQGAGCDHRVLPGGLAEQQGHGPGGPADFEHADPGGPADRVLLRPQDAENLLVDLGSADGFQALPGRLADGALRGGQLDQGGQGRHVAHGTQGPRGRQADRFLGALDRRQDRRRQGRRVRGSEWRQARRPGTSRAASPCRPRWRPGPRRIECATRRRLPPGPWRRRRQSDWATARHRRALASDAAQGARADQPRLVRS